MKTVKKSTSKSCNNPFLGFVSVAMSIILVREISSIKYAEVSGIPHKRVKEWCI